ncbi:MAG: Gfo/Idh/MocA family oxidoreductase [Bacteroidetes bacterium]|nr:Gfo/Idh/MocA family oxidoreductase [Bacteroidota bacterium]
MGISALIIGCGNIGALYDLDAPEKVWTHAKAFSLCKKLRFTIADTNEVSLKKVSQRYDVQVATLSKDFDYSRYDIVSITTPTSTHFDYLKLALTQNVPVVICEKPVAASADDLDRLLQFYGQSRSRVLVNYIRRFQPAFTVLKLRLASVIQADTCVAIVIKYQRGFLNNGGHAFDLLEFLFDKPFLFERFEIQSAVFDAFEHDPTITGTCHFGEIPVSIIGVAAASYPVFEIELFFRNQKIVVCHSGDEVRYYETSEQSSQLSENLKLRQSDILKQYMVPVVIQALVLLKNEYYPDNFQQAAQLNRRMVNLLPLNAK